MALNTKRLTRQQAHTKGGGSGDFLKLVDGRNIWRIFTFPHTVSKDDFTRGIYRQSDDVKVGDTFDEIERESKRHFTEDGIVNCLLTKDCPYCKDANALLASKSERDKKAGKQLSARFVYNVNAVNMEEIDKGVQLGSMPSTVFNAILNYVMDPEFGEDILGCQGRDFLIERDSKQDPANMYKVKIRDANRCEELDASLQESVRDLFDMPIFEAGWSSNESLRLTQATPEKEEKEEEPARTQRPPVEREREPEQGKAQKTTGARRRNEPEDNEFTDTKDSKEEPEAGGPDDLPWDKKSSAKKTPKFDLEDIVVFEDEGKPLHGEVVEVNGDMLVIKAGKDLYDIPASECKPKKSNKR